MGKGNVISGHPAGSALPAILMVLALVSCGAADIPDDPSNSATVVPEATAEPVIAPAGEWSTEEVDRLLHWVKAAPQDALPSPSSRDLDTAIASGDHSAIDGAATALALKLGRMHLLGVANTAQRTGWHITDSDSAIDLQARLEKAIGSDDIDGFIENLRPSSPDYAALRDAYAAETDKDRRATIARNMERWRWMPQSLGQSYVLVNTATFEARLWRNGKQAGTWRVIVGKRSTPSPVFSARITGVTLNPWWNIPASIVREKHGNFPARLGYVRTANGFAQKPGPNNALGQMKLVMPNPFSVYMHDTPSKSLFARDIRAFSHGCIRVGEALNFATTLLNGEKTPSEVDAIVAGGQTTTISLPSSLPVYITYFTAGLLGDGSFVIQPDIYSRDKNLPDLARASETECSASG
ncbi:L,D-transpeptidase family protein [Novosphingobium album (ex Hu et al. 2023)]|uniref:L,D-transpeptidase family protein n=1 Tax=Novosphingobium album (ex Hu et al. 2023) TaxID=2930093 RepID=A0ABT0AZV4_9SPHN|nr:L,D-transpeptidase family protein [Novosphingobium album (ex Hu et al. 2023)]MCJ2178064.1 L,D-transpeptidase family protein [Novosphingobium album (ex Hu et al. 2023)]